MKTRDGTPYIEPIGVLQALHHHRVREALDSPGWKAPPLATPLVILVVGTVFFRFTQADVAISSLFFSSATQEWPLLRAQPWRMIYRFGVAPALILGFGGLAVALLGFFWARLRPWRRAGAFFALLLLLGPGLLVNGLFKPHWMRPRPMQTATFGGQQQFEPVWDMGTDVESRSFPSGHASMGFYLMAPAFLFYTRRRRLALRWFAVGLTGGGVMGLTRIVQGGHFASDVLWSAGCVYFTGVLLYAVLRLGHVASESDARPASLPQVFEIESAAKPHESADEAGYRRAA